MIGIIGGSLGAIGALLSIGGTLPMVVPGRVLPLHVHRHGILVFGEDEDRNKRLTGEGGRGRRAPAPEGRL